MSLEKVIFLIDVNSTFLSGSGISGCIIEHGQDIHPSESAIVLTKECREVAARQMHDTDFSFKERIAYVQG